VIDTLGDEPRSPGLRRQVSKTFDRASVRLPGRGTPTSSGFVTGVEEQWMSTFWLAFGVIFVAELGDKSQLMALAFASRYKALPILIGITIATAVVHAVSVLLGAVLSVSLPTHLISLIAGVAFLGFAAWTLHGDELDDDEADKVNRNTRSAVIAASSAFFLAELGDKTMLATITLASTNSVFWVWLGSTVGMVFADALAILAGKQLGARLPERTIRIAASISFVVFGVLLIVEALR
jgi:putative Ca2+/H+ antiporter (TMEM165/GDT1 family)